MTLLVGALGHGSTTVGLIVLSSLLVGLAGILLARLTAARTTD